MVFVNILNSTTVKGRNEILIAHVSENHISEKEEFSDVNWGRYSMICLDVRLSQL
jgi:hypothetical protein